MRKVQPIQPKRPAGFTLIELLVVIGIIAVLAAMIFPASNMIKVKGMRSKAKAELEQVASAIDSYHAKYGHYPPDNPLTTNPNRFVLNPLFYELQGTRKTQVGAQQVYETLDGRTNLPVGLVPVRLPGVMGFVNCTQGGGDEIAAAQTFLSKLTPGRYGFNSDGVGFLTTSVAWPERFGPVIPGAASDLNPIRYNSSSPTNNPKSYDLWVDIVVGGKTNRISNWSQQYEVVSN